MAYPTPFKHQIIIAEQNLLNAIRNGDLAALDRLIHPDLQFIIPGGQTITKETELDNYRSGKMKVASLESTDSNVQIIGDNAVVSVTVALKGHFETESIDQSFKYLRVWKRIEGDWKIIAGSSTPELIPEGKVW